MSLAKKMNKGNNSKTGQIKVMVPLNCTLHYHPPTLCEVFKHMSYRLFCLPIQKNVCSVQASVTSKDISDTSFT